MDQAHAWTDRRLRDIEKRVTEEYTAAFEEMQIKAMEYFITFRKEDEKKKKLVEKGEMTEREYGKWRAAEMAQGNRYRALVKSLSESLTNSAQISIDLVNGRLPEIYGYNHDFGTYEIESGTTIDTSYALYDRDAVYAAMSDRQLYPEAKVNRSKDVAWNRRHVNSAITQGLLQGETIPQIAERLANVASMSATTAMRAARTTVTSAENSGRLDSYRRAERLGISVKKMWLATMDTRTRSSHRRLDGESVPVDEEFSNGLMYPADPDGPGTEIYNCRCTMIADLSEYPSEQVSRFSKLKDMSYDEWRGEHEERTIAPPTSPAPVRYGEFRGLSYVDDGLGAHEGDGSDLDPVRMVAEDTGFSDARARQAIQDVARWVGNDYTRIRTHDPSTEDVRERLEEFLEASPKYEGTVWRGVGLERADAEDVLQALRTGGEIDQRGVSSWATESDWATEFAEMNVERRDDGVSIVFRLDENRSGVSIKHVASIDNDEVVAPEGVRYVLSGEIEWVEDQYDGDYWLVPVKEVY